MLYEIQLKTVLKQFFVKQIYQNSRFVYLFIVLLKQIVRISDIILWSNL